MSYIPGILANPNVTPTTPGEDVVPVSDLIAYVDPDLTPFTTIIMQNKRKEPVDNYRYFWYTQDLLEARQINVDAGFVDNGARASGASFTITIDAAFKNMLNAYVPGSLVQVEATGEVLKVNAFDANAGTLTVYGGWGYDATNTTGTPAPGNGGAVIPASSVLTLFSNSNSQGADAPNTFVQKPTQRFNYTQIFKMKYGATGTVAATRMVWGSELTREDFEKGELFKLSMEDAFIRGERNSQINLIDNKLETTVGGLIFQLKEFSKTGFGYVDYSPNAPFTEATFDDFLETDVFQRAFRHGKKDKVAFVSRQMAGFLNRIAKGKLETKQDESTYGIKVSQWQTIYGTANIIVHDLLPETVSGSTVSGTIVVIETDAIKYRPLIGNGLNRDVQLKRNIQLPGSDEIVHMYFAEAGLQIESPERHFYADKIPINIS